MARGDLPARNPGFAGREALLSAVREALLSGDRAVVQALHGMGGVGKTQLAIEYAHRYAASYDVVWWVNAEQAGLIGEQFAALGVTLGCAEAGAGLTAVRRALLGDLARRDRWLLVFDNAEDPEEVAQWLPGGAGHVLITSRSPRWSEAAVPVEVDVLARAESVEILRRRVAGLGETDADLVAAAVGDLPLAVAQAAGYMAATGATAAGYATLLGERAAEVLDQERPSSYPRSLAAVTQLAFGRLTAEDQAAGQALAVCAFLAPEPVPAVWFTSAAADLTGPLRKTAADPVAWGRVLARIGDQALARVDGQGLLVHRLTQAIIRSRLASDEAAVARADAAALLTAGHPGDQELPTKWPEWARLMPHLLALDPAASAPAVSDLTVDAAWYLIRRGDTRNACDLAARLHQHLLDRSGPDDPVALDAAATLASALRHAGRYEQARELDEDTLARRCQVLGQDHPRTLASASTLAASLSSLGQHQAARRLNEDTLARRSRVLGRDHRDTLASAGSLAHELSALGEHQAARELDQDTLARRRRVLGENHPWTLTSASYLAADLRELGEHQAARDLIQDTIARRRRLLGQDHPSTLTSASDLARVLFGLGEYRAALEVDKDVLARRRRVLGDDHPDTQCSARDLAADLRAVRETSG